ncbi:hypothetical protein TK5_19220 [Sideroxyarcus sp. TK5]
MLRQMRIHLHPVGHGRHLQALRGEIFLQQFAQAGIVIHHQYVSAFHALTITEANGLRQGAGGAVTLCYKLLQCGNRRVTAGAHHAAIRDRSDIQTTKENIMKTTSILLNSLLALTLAGIGNAYAAEEAQVQTREEIRAQHREETAGMTAAQREEYRLQKQTEMTAEQRAALRAEKQKAKAEQKKNKSATKQGAGNGTMLRDGSGAGSQRGSQGGMGMGR